jgi:hypothetical protein
MSTSGWMLEAPVLAFREDLEDGVVFVERARPPLGEAELNN